MIFYLINEMIVSGTFEITVECKIAKCLPWRLIRMNVHGMDGMAVGRDGRHVVPHGRGGHHGDAGHGAVT